MPKLQDQVKEEMLARIDALAHRQDRDTDEVVLDALGKYLEWHDTQMHLWKETEKAILEADRGEVVSGEEVFAWLDTWGKPLENAV